MMGGVALTKQEKLETWIVYKDSSDFLEMLPEKFDEHIPVFKGLFDECMDYIALHQNPQYYMQTGYMVIKSKRGNLYNCKEQGVNENNGKIIMRGTLGECAQYIRENS